MRRLIPDLKLIFVMRDPLERAWSHARHSFCQGEANFKGNRVTIDEVTDEDWIVNLDDEWNRLSGDYLGQLQRWLSVFPREQVYLGFFEDLVSSPRKLFRHVLEFLDLDPDFADSPAVTTDAVNVGSPKRLRPASCGTCGDSMPGGPPNWPPTSIGSFRSACRPPGSDRSAAAFFPGPSA